jgi:hypothetical protein
LKTDALISQRVRAESPNMADLLYIILTVFFFLACWAFARACDRL